MKRILSFGISALVVAIAMFAAVPTWANTIPFDASGSGISVNLIITVGAPIGAPGGYNITDVSGDFTDLALGINGAPVTLVPDQGSTSVITYGGKTGSVFTSLDGAWNYDNAAFPAGTPLLFDAFGGILFTLPSGGNTFEVNIAGERGGYEVWASENGAYVINGTTGEPLVATPEPSSLSFLGLGLLALAGLLRNKFPRLVRNN